MAAVDKTEVTLKKWFNRDFEKSFGPLESAQFPPIDWSRSDHVEALFPQYKREQLKAERAKGPKNTNKTIEIYGFNLFTPTKDKQLFKQTGFSIEPQKRCAVYGENGSGTALLLHTQSSHHLCTVIYSKTSLNSSLVLQIAHRIYCFVRQDHALPRAGFRRSARLPADAQHAPHAGDAHAP
jgi:ABC-type transport system involved in cytochrome bd biosynthesis fused ATPase/permease subunit